MYTDRDGHQTSSLDLAIQVLNIKQLEEQAKAIKQQNEQLESIIENISEGLAVVDANGNYVRMNKKLKEFITRITKIRTPIQKVDDSTKLDEKFYDSEGNLLKAEEFPGARVARGEKFENVQIIVTNETNNFYFLFSGNPVYDEHENFMYGTLIIKEITEQVSKEEMTKKQQQTLLLAEYEKNKALQRAIKKKDEFLATITHEFKTPLTVINAAVQTINTLYGTKLPENVKKHIQRIRTNSFRQLRLVNNLLDITKFNAGHAKSQMQNHDIIFLTHALVQSVKPFAAQKRINIYFSAEETYKEMAIDEEKYERILLNLLSNAIKYTPKGKSIYVHISFHCKKAMIAVQDEGVGIPEDKRTLIFDRYGQVDNILTRQAEGMGIGLSLVKTLVKVLGGTITLESTVGIGSTFTVILPSKKIRSNRDPFQMSIEQTDTRIMQAVAIEFSDLYGTEEVV